MAYVDLTWYSLETGREIGRVPFYNYKSITPYELRQIFGEQVSSCVHAVTPEHVRAIRANWLPDQKFDFENFGYEVEYSMTAVIENSKGRQKVYF